MAVVLGVDLSTVPAQFPDFTLGRTLILDGDSLAYKAAATSKRLDTAIRKFQSMVLTEMFVTASQFCTVHLTAVTCAKAGRGNIIGVKPYQGQRKGKDKPPLLEPLREAVCTREHAMAEFDCKLHFDVEADDAMMMQAYLLKDDGLIWSEDKDLRMTPYPYWDMELGIAMKGEPEGYLKQAYTPGGSLKIVGQGPKFFWCQMLMGDSADNVQGITRLHGKLCGPAGAFAALDPIKGIDNIANFVLDGYRAVDQNPLPEGYFLWLLRRHGDSFWHYLQELNLTEENRAFVNECVTREWFKRADGGAV